MSDSQTILAVDDRSENLLALEKCLTISDARLVKVTSGQQALAASLEQEFALAILDVQMPGMDGFELAELLRGDPKTKHLPIIFLMGNGRLARADALRTQLVPVVVLNSSDEEGDPSQSCRLGANSYVRKPLALAALTAAVQRAGEYWLRHNEPPPIGRAR